MDNDGFIARIERPHQSLDYHWSLRSTGVPLPKPLSLSGYTHSVMTTDIYVSFHLTGKLHKWQGKPINHRTLEEDAKAVFDFSSDIFYIEVDRATEPEGAIRSKAKRYMKLEETFHVIFVVPHLSRAEEVLDELPRDSGTRFLVCLYDAIHADPRDQIYVAASRPTDFQSLSDILSSVRSDG